MRRYVAKVAEGISAPAGRPVTMSVEISKTDAERGIVWGYASAADLVDLQGDTIPQAEMENAFYEFMEAYYEGAALMKENHGEAAPVVIVEATLEWKAGRLRWYLGVKLRSEELLEKARAGEISGFSIGGWAKDEEDG